LHIATAVTAMTRAILFFSETGMKFYDRLSEINTLCRIEKMSEKAAQMTIMVGRRRVGKTTLLKNAYSNTPVLYFFVAKKNEVLLCEEFSQEIDDKLTERAGLFRSFSELFKFIMRISERLRFTLIIDEFQEFQHINKSIFSDMQNIWDSYKDKSQINLVLCGSIYSMMKQIFENAKEPLFGRAGSKIVIRPFDTATIKKVLSDHYPDYCNEDLLAFYMLTGGVAKYMDQLMMCSAYTKETMLDSLFEVGSLFLDEGRAVLIDEFGKDYSNYFSVLSLIASSRAERGMIERILGMPVGGYLDRLEKEYGLIRRLRPFMAKEGSRFNKYVIEDNFLNFWFRFIYKYRSAIEIGNLQYVRDIVARDYEVYSGIMLEKYFRTKLMEANKYSDIQGYWDRKGENEIDIVAVNEMQKEIVFYEVKRNKKKINLALLKQKSTSIILKYPAFKADYIALSMDDM